MAGGQGVAGSNPAVPTQVKGWFRVSAAIFWLQWERTCAPIRCTGQAEWRVLPSRHADQRLPAISAAACWFAPFPADSCELSSRSRGRRFRSGRQRQVLGNNSRRRAPASGCHFVPPGSSLPCYVERMASDAHCRCPWAARRSASWWPQPQLRFVTHGDNLHGVAPYARRQIEYLHLSEGGRHCRIEHRSARSGQHQRYPLPPESCGTRRGCSRRGHGDAAVPVDDPQSGRAFDDAAPVSGELVRP
jgi:hypothetical protein